MLFWPSKWGIHLGYLINYLGEGNGTPLQYSCLENPKDGGAWWAAVHGVTKSQTGLKWLSSRINWFTIMKNPNKQFTEILNSFQDSFENAIVLLMCKFPSEIISNSSFHLFYSIKNLQVKVKLLSYVWLFATPWTVAHQAPPSMGFSRQEYWSGLPFASPGDLPNPGIDPTSPAL